MCILYRFQPLAAPGDSEDRHVEYLRRARQVIVESKLWLTSPLDFNDPYDNRALIPTPTAEQHQRFYSWMIHYQGHAALRRGQISQEELDEKARLYERPEKCHKWATDRIDEVLGERGVTCLSACRDNIAMWGHYANGHWGLCFGFDKSRCRVLNEAQPVRYLKIPPPFNYFADFTDGVEKLGSEARKKEILEVCLSKWHGWEREAEWRLVTAEMPDEHYAPFSSDALTEIILGCRVEDAVIDRIQAMVRERAAPVPLYKAHLVDGAFALRFDPVA